MNQYQAQAAKVIDARPEQLYAIIADYQEGHPSILPRRYFTDLVITAGGRGAGTAATVHMNVFGAKAVYHVVVSEPEPGRVLLEEDSAAGVATTFLLDPVNGGGQTRVTISTQATTRPGLRGFVEKLLNPPVMRRIYRQELAQLAQVVQTKGD